MSLPNWRDWVFALKVLAAAVLALFIALWIDLPRPYWAVSTVFITMQPAQPARRPRRPITKYRRHHRTIDSPRA
jgi:uncharacterized membrane protein YccC